MANTPKEIASVAKIFADNNLPLTTFNSVKQITAALKEAGWQFIIPQTEEKV